MNSIELNKIMNNLKKIIRKKILLKLPVKTILRNILKGSKVFTIMSFLYVGVFTICLLLLYKHYRENKKHCSQLQTGKLNIIHVQDEQKNLSLQIKNLHQYIFNIEVKINKIICILQENNNLSKSDLVSP